MNILFLTLYNINNLSERGIYQDLMREFTRHNHNVYVASATEKRNGIPTSIEKQEYGTLLRVQTGNIQKTNIIEKGISTLTLENKFVCAIKKHFDNVKFDLVIYSTPPITLAKAVAYIKKRDGAKSYLLLKDIFPQNSVDLGLLHTDGFKAPIYKLFRIKEKRLYALSDRIGCMSPANVKYLLEHNPELDSKIVEVCPNSEEFSPVNLSEKERIEIRDKYGLPLDEKIFIYGGNLGRPQCVPFIVKCLKECSDSYFVIVGSGTDRHVLEEYIDREKPKNVQLLQHLLKFDYERLVAACDVGLIFLDYRFTIPNFPSRLITYMQAGIPVLNCTDKVTDIGSICEASGFGWRTYSNDVENFEEKIHEIQRCSFNELKAMGFKGRKYFEEHYTVEVSYEIISKSLLLAI